MTGKKTKIEKKRKTEGPKRYKRKGEAEKELEEKKMKRGTKWATDSRYGSKTTCKSQGNGRLNEKEKTETNGQKADEKNKRVKKTKKKR